jgi:hypothetical protein
VSLDPLWGYANGLLAHHRQRNAKACALPTVAVDNDGNVDDEQETLRTNDLGP